MEGPVTIPEPLALQVERAPALVSAATAGQKPVFGQPVTVGVVVTTDGTRPARPSGTVTLTEAGTVLARVPLDGDGNGWAILTELLAGAGR